jgi:hypothetical protein
MMCGSCFGAVSWASRMMSQVNFYQANDLTATGNAEVVPQANSFLALTWSWAAAHHGTYAAEFLFLSAAQLMVLDRMSDFVTLQGDGARKWWVAGGRAVMAAVVLCNAVGLATSVAAAIYFQKSADAYSAASVLYASNNTKDAKYYVQLAFNISSARSVCEVTALLLIVLVFAVVGVACIRRLSSALTLLNSADPDMAAQHRNIFNEALDLGRRLRQEVVVTTSFVFVAFLLRSVGSTLIAVANMLQDKANACPGVTSLCDPSCYNVYTRIWVWNSYTPEYSTTVVLISSPLTLLVALWGMTSKLTLQLMRSRPRHMAPTTASPVGLNALRLPIVAEEVPLT